jgi:hypothetical protein
MLGDSRPSPPLPSTHAGLLSTISFLTLLSDSICKRNPEPQDLPTEYLPLLRSNDLFSNGSLTLFANWDIFAGALNGDAIQMVRLIAKGLGDFLQRQTICLFEQSVGKTAFSPKSQT